jgi:tetratricopeptide (TPR) repeat protein
MTDQVAQTDGGWPEWVDRHRYGVGGVVFLAFFILYGCLVYASGQRKLTSLEQAALAVTGVVISASLGVVLALPFAKRRIRIGSQLRRAYGICQTLRNTQESIVEASARMQERTRLDSETTNEFWLEIAISVRTAIQIAILDAERIVQDWGEMDAEERARIQQEEEELTHKINELYTELETARSLERDVDDATVSQSLSRAVERLEAQIRILQGSVGPKPEVVSPSARVFLNRGEYHKAVAAYDESIRRYPTVHTNYLGRAKARYLAGDIDGALLDLTTAESMYPADPVIAQLRAQISAKGPVTVSAADTSANHEVTAGNEALSRGDATAAQQHYRKAEELGWNPAFVRCNLAMASAVTGDVPDTLEQLSKFQPYTDSYSALHATV